MVQTVHHPDTYCCTVCGQEYEEYWRAELCESFPVLKAPYEIGQLINVQTRYEGVASAVVTETRLTNYATAFLMVGKSKEIILNSLAQRDDVAEIQHSYAVVIDKELQLGKELFTNVCRIGDIVPNP